MGRFQRMVLSGLMGLLYLAASTLHVVADESTERVGVAPVAPTEATVDNPKPLDDAAIETLIRQLDSNQYLTRERATQELLAAGVETLDPLLAAANGKRPEPADRAVWILRKQADSENHDVALAALDRLVNLQNRPAVVQEASLARARFYEAACQQKLAKLGAQLIVTDNVLPEHGVVRVVQITFGDSWAGTNEDLKCLADLKDHRFFRIDGPPVDDETVKLFANMEGLGLLQLVNTRVTPAAVDELKERRPKAVVYVKNRALLGIEGGTTPQGVLVRNARENLGAAIAGITAGDIITHIDGEPVKDFDRLTARVAQYEPGKEIDVRIIRGSEKVTKRVKLSDWATQPGM